MKCPCEECISFAICNSVMKEIMDISHLTIERDCIILRRYIQEKDSDLYYEKINAARKLYNLPLLHRRDII